MKQKDPKTPKATDSAATHNPADFHNAPKSEQARWSRNHRIERAIERSWYYFCTQGDPLHGHRIPLGKSGLSMARYVGASAEIATRYLLECCGTDRDSPDPSEFPFEKETVTVQGSPTLYYRPRDQEELKARLRDMRRNRPGKAKGGGNA